MAELLADDLEPPGALIDKDITYGGFVAATLAAAGRPPGEREGPWYDRHIKTYEYAGLAATAREIRRHGCAVVLCGPFTGQIHDEVRWRAFVAELGGPPVQLVWLRSDPSTVRQRLLRRGSARDTQKLAEYDEFVAATRIGQAPPVAHVAIDNRSDGIADLVAQVAGLASG